MVVPPEVSATAQQAAVASVDAAAAPQKPTTPSPPPDEHPPPPSLMEMAQALWLQVRGVVHDQFELLTLEAQMAGQALAHLLILGAAMGVLLAGTWLCVLLAGGLWLWEQGWRASYIVLLALLLNGAVLGALALAMRRARRAMGFGRSLQALQPEVTSEFASKVPHEPARKN